MSSVPDKTLGALVKAKTASAEVATGLAKAIFDGKREMKVGELTIIAPSFSKLTSHEQTILKGLFLKAEVKS